VYCAEFELALPEKDVGPIKRTTMPRVIITSLMPTERTIIRVSTLQEQDRSDDLLKTTPAERLQMMWQITLDAWTFKGEPIAELRLPRHIVRVLRRES
jgi:hypothetical protein